MAGHRTTITRKGQVTIPIDIRRELELNEGDHLSVERQGDNVVFARALSVAERTKGMLSEHRRPTPLTPSQERAIFEQAVADEVLGAE